MQAWHYEGPTIIFRSMIKHRRADQAEVQITDDEAFLDAGAVQVRVDRKNFRYSFEADGKVL